MAKAIIDETPKLGEGIYLTKDISDILGLPYANVRYAMNGFWFSYQFGENRNKAVNFRALIEFYVYYHLRKAKVSASEIKALHGFLSKKLNTKYPFASVRIGTHKDQIWWDYKGQLMKGDQKLQPTFRTFIDPFLKKIEFGKDSLAERYYPLNNSKNIVVDPLHQFGQPTLKGTNIQTTAVYNLYKAGESAKDISKLYDVTVSQVNDAILYYKRIA